jgi:type II secretory pathway pseudopilin PulG
MLQETDKREGTRNRLKKAVAVVTSLKRAFTLPEVIISFSILVMVVTSAVGLLTVVIRTNSDNVNSLVANGLAQEGLEAVRFMRDSNALLGLDFDGTKGTVLSQSLWGGLTADPAGGPRYFMLPANFEAGSAVCQTANLVDCRPVWLEELSAIDDSIWETFDNSVLEQISAIAAVYLLENNVQDGGVGDSSNFRYFQLAEGEVVPEGSRQTQYSRLIRLEPLRSENVGTESGEILGDVLRVSSIVTWADANGRPRRLVLTTDLTDWK